MARCPGPPPVTQKAQLSKAAPKAGGNAAESVKTPQNLAPNLSNTCGSGTSAKLLFKETGQRHYLSCSKSARRGTCFKHTNPKFYWLQ